MKSFEIIIKDENRHFGFTVESELEHDLDIIDAIKNALAKKTNPLIAKGGLVKVDSSDNKKELSANGVIKVTQPVLDKYGVDFLREVNNSPCADVIVTK